MDSFVLQTSDSNIQNGDVLGRVGFAANEADTGDARAVSAIVYAMAEAPFTSIANPTSLVFATAVSGDAYDKLKITSSGHFLPLTSGEYDIGSALYPFQKVFTDELRVSDYNFPTSDGTNGHVLSTDGAGQLSFIPVTSASDTFVDSLDFNTSTNVLTIGRNDGVDFSEIINAGGGTIDGGGTAGYNAKWVDSDTLTSGIIHESGNTLGINTLAHGSSIIAWFKNIGSNGSWIINESTSSAYPVVFEARENGKRLGVMYSYGSTYGGGSFASVGPSGVAFSNVTGDVAVGPLSTTKDLILGAGSGQYAKLTNSEFIVNHNQGSRHFRVAGTTDENLLYVDGSTNSIGIGTNFSGNNKLRIHHDLAEYNSENTAHIKIQDSGGTIGGLFGADRINDVFYIQAVDPGSSWAKDIALQAMGGKVGVGTVNPAPAGGDTSIHIAATNYPELKLTNDVTGHAAQSGTAIQVVNNTFRVTNRQPSSSLQFYAFDSAGISRQRLWLGPSSASFNYIGENVDFQVMGSFTHTDGNQYRVIYGDASTGRLGIGTTNPLTALHVAAGIGSEGTVISQTADSGSWAGYLVRDYLDRNVGSFQFGNIETNHTPSLRETLFLGSRESGIPVKFFQGKELNGAFQHNNERMILDADGNTILTAASGQQIFASGQSVMIPTASPSGSTLLIGRHPYQSSIKAEGSTQQNQWLIMDSAGHPAGLNYFSSDNVLLAYGGGNVGVGTRSPGSGPGSYKFRVTGGHSVFDGGNVVVNQDKGNYDFRVKGVSDEALIHTDGFSNNVGIGIEASASSVEDYKLFIYQNTNLDQHGYSGRGIYLDCNHSFGYTNGTDDLKYSLGISTDVRQNVAMGVHNSGYSMGVDAVGLVVGDGSIAQAYGLRTYGGGHTNFGASGLINQTFGIRNRVLNLGSGVMNTAFGLFSEISEGSNGTINNSYHIYLAAASVSSTNKFGIYQVGADEPNYFNSNVMIGRNSSHEFAGFKSLSIDGTAGSFIDLYEAGTARFRLQGDATYGALQTLSAIPLRFLTNQLERMRITASGDVGINTTAPTNQLDIYATGVHAGATIRGTNAPGLKLWDMSYGTYNNGGSKIVEQASSLHSGVLIIDADTDNVGHGSYMSLRVDGTERVQITEHGNLGIGVDPDLFIRDFPSHHPSLVLGDGNGHTSQTFYSSSNSSAVIYFADGTTAPATYSGYIQYAHDINRMQFATNSLVRMRIDANGHVGIGATTPAYHLDVDGAGRFTSGIVVPINTILAKAHPNIQLNGPDLYDGWLIAHVDDCYGVGNNNNDGLLIEKRDGNDTVPDGGIIFANRGMNGNSIPSLSINGFGHVSIGKMVSPFLGDNNRLVIESGNFVFNGDNGNYDFKVHGDNESNLLYVDASTGRVGIGTSSPKSRLHVMDNTITDSVHDMIADGSMGATPMQVYAENESNTSQSPGGFSFSSTKNNGVTCGAALTASAPRDGYGWSPDIILSARANIPYGGATWTKRLVISSRGRVSIPDERNRAGSDADDWKFQVNDSTTGASGIFAVEAGTVGFGAYVRASGDGYPFLSLGTHQTNNWVMMNDPTIGNTFSIRKGNIATNDDKLTIDNAGHVSIGTSSHPGSLTVTSGDAQINKILIGSQAYSIGSHTQGITHVDYDDNQSYMIISDGDSTYTSCHNLGGFNYMRGPQNSSTYQVVVGNSYMFIGTTTTERMTVGSTETVFNQDANNYDFRVESEDISKALFVDANLNHAEIHRAVGYGVNYATSDGWVESTSFSAQGGYYGGNFVRNGETAANHVEHGDLPNGARGLLWRSKSNESWDGVGANPGADGGWNKDIEALDPNRSYLSVVYVRRVSDDSDSAGGYFYHGCQTAGRNPATGDFEYFYTTDMDGSGVINPYFNITNASNLPKDVWCLSIGFIRAASDPDTTQTNITGIYRLDTGQTVAQYNSTFPQEYRMGNDVNLDPQYSQRHRTYLYYDNRGTTQLDWCWPGFYELTSDYAQDLLLQLNQGHIVTNPAGNSLNSDNTVIQSLEFDSFGHVTSVTTHEENYVDDVDFDTNTGILSLDYKDGSTGLTKDLDGRYLVSANSDGTGLTLTNGVFDVNVSSTVQTVAANSVSSTASRTYAVQVDSSDNLVVNIPWTDTQPNTVQQIQDIVGGMVDGNDETNIDVTYDSASGKLDFEVGGGSSGGSAPIGSVIYSASSTAPAGFLKANGAAVSRSAYSGLFAAIGTTYGAGDGSTTFNLPDLRGEFIRGFDDQRGVDSSRAFGSTQADSFKAHEHGIRLEHGNYPQRYLGRYAPPNGQYLHVNGGGILYPYSNRYGHYNGTKPIEEVGDAETRPRNIALLACIKY